MAGHDHRHPSRRSLRLRFNDLQIDWNDTDGGDGILEVRRNYVRRAGFSKEKATKTHRMRRIALDNETVTLLHEHRERVKGSR